uniref:NADH dehydrogenase subunit 6 n=1 Tax=Hydatigena taeniaeformis TaxID=6205 RepID=A0A1E1GI80_HYDTA|nr:NADH dehydrogenase subunit 6 [Hydatigera taeniaeformis]BAV82585.1 NADH dehydrogenase subunit 6 [Hydatigera taeniaeformis]
MVSILLSLYLFNLFLFSLVSSCIYYCIILIINALLSSYIVYEVMGFSWYSLIFCLIYVGGVYILFIFVSFFNPNDSVMISWGFNLVSLVLIFFVFGVSIYMFCELIEFEFSSCVCNFNEIWLYVCFGLMLMFGFVILSMLMSYGVGFYR